jgi:hypothetical protein
MCWFWKSEEVRLLERVLEILGRIERQLEPDRITRFVIAEQETPMGLLAIAPGNSPVFTATPVPSTSVPLTPPTWISSDTTNAPVTVDSTGLIATVAIPTNAVVGTVFTLTVNYTNADGTAATGSIILSIVAGPSPDITGFTIEQTS